MAKWNDNLTRYKKSKRFKHRVANARKNRYRLSKLKLSKIAVKIADVSGIDVTLSQGSEWVRDGKESPERQIEIKKLHPQ